MPFQKIPAQKLSQAVQSQIESLILQGILRPGERLPAERELSESLGVSRPSLREAIADLQQAGLLTSRPGSGIYVAEVLGSAFAPALVRLISRHERAPYDYLDFRKDIEGLAAERAARHASDADLGVIAATLAQMEKARQVNDAQVESALDVQFHMAIVEASHNIIALHMMRAMYDLLREGVFYNRARLFDDPAIRAALLDQHRAINAALQDRDGPRARQAIVVHLDFVSTRLAAQARSDANADIARLRLRHIAE
ncbi:MAG: FCD domain-containing protein [Paracoccus sp. (in: a-proteobacteria)]|uniref:FadR/GntR family transcriptional regulator n=1 Tax=Paracoccus sp. TaxID=267 RepID=UPI0026E01350|nr:FCD domain-containing protein [Paracoccus sp. (in: a-proteobacteria)]MDO5630460.1 FCD domain-containing protein [Paracoccus sp. (in: a-proteobacteria)]